MSRIQQYEFELPMPEFLQPSPQGHLAEVEGMEMYFEVHGQGEPLVLLHGFHGCGRVWNPFLPALAEHYQVIVPDLRGHGRSSNPSGQFTHRQAGRDVYALLDALGVERFAAMGASTGGMTLLHMATSQPDRPASLVLVFATTEFGEPARQIMRLSDPAKLTEQEMAEYRKIHLRGDEQIRALRGQFHAFKDDYEDMNFTAPLLSTIRARTLIVHGDRDAFFPVEIPLGMYRAIPNSYLRIVPNWGHGPLDRVRETLIAETLALLRGDWENKPHA